MNGIRSRPPIAWWDVLLVVVLVLAGLAIGVWGGFLGILTLAFADHCPPGECASSTVPVRLLGATALWLAALVASIVVLALRRRAWWIALLGTLGVTAIWGELIVRAIA